MNKSAVTRIAILTGNVEEVPVLCLAAVPRHHPQQLRALHYRSSRIDPKSLASVCSLAFNCKLGIRHFPLASPAPGAPPRPPCTWPVCWCRARRPPAIGTDRSSSQHRVTRPGHTPAPPPRWWTPPAGSGSGCPPAKCR